MNMNMNIPMQCLLSVIILFTPLFGLCAPPVVLEEGNGEYPLGLHLDLLEDKQGSWSLDDVMRGDLAKQFVTNLSKHPAFPDSQSIYWARFTLNQQLKTNMVLVSDGRKFLPFQLFIPVSENDYIVKQADPAVGFDQREIAYRFFAFNLPQTTMSNQYIYIRVEPHKLLGGIYFPFRLYQPEVFQKKIVHSYSIFSSYGGLIVVMLLYNLFIYFSVRDKSYLFYVAYIFMVGMATLSMLGLGFQYLWPNMPQWNVYSWYIWPSLTFIFLFKFFQTILTTWKNCPKLHRLISFVIVAWFCLIPMLFFNLRLSISLIMVLAVISVTVIVLIIVLRIRQGSQTAKFMGAAFGFFLLGILFYIMHAMGNFLGNIFVVYSPLFGVAIEVVVLALALANRINTMNQRLSDQAIVLEKNAMELANKNTELNKLDRLKDEFLANTSHELRTPLNGIIGLSDALLQGVAGTLSVKATHNLGLIKSSGQRLFGLVVDLLDMSKLKSGKVELTWDIVDLYGIANTVLEVTKSTIVGKKLELINDILHGTIVHGDKNRLEQVLYNLIGNAVKFSESGFVRIHTIIQGERIQVCVEDTGIGIARDQQQEIFNEFVQADGSTERAYAGTGLGLSVVKQLIALHHGTVEVASELGKGSIFSFDLRIADAVLKQDLPDQAKARMSKSGDVHSSSNAAMAGMAKSGDVHSSTNNAVMAKSGDVHSSTNAVMAELPKSGQKSINAKTILIVDDEELNREVLANYLEINNFESLIARDGLEGLAMIQSTLPDLIMLDIMMPQMSGYDFCRKVRETYSETELPIIMVTAKTKEEDLALGFMVGANDYVTKPYNRDILFARVSTHLTISKQYTEVKQADRAKTEFFKVMSHELRTPLNAIIGYTDMVCEDLSDEEGMDEYVDDLNKALTAGKNLLTMINAVLDLNKIAAGDVSITITAFAIQPFMAVIYQLFVPLLAKTKNKLSIDIAQQPPLIYTDYQKLLLVIANLVENGCKFTHGGDIKVSINFIVNSTQFVISDTGIGIHPEHIEKIFAPFMQADTSDTRKYGGTGIGLALVKANTDLLHGQIDVTSREGEGSKFTLVVPNLKV